MPRFEQIESLALRMIAERGDKGILQSELWKKLNVSSREVSRLSLRFERKDLIERKKVLNEGRWTYKLVSRRKDISIESIMDCPCLLCDDLERCTEMGAISSVNCDRLIEWVIPPVKEGKTSK
jgi:hypothetical protein